MGMISRSLQQQRGAANFQFIRLKKYDTSSQCIFFSYIYSICPCIFFRLCFVQHLPCFYTFFVLPHKQINKQNIIIVHFKNKIPCPSTET